MNYLLDTSVLIDLLRQKANVMAFFNKHINDRLMTSWICAGEVFEGIYQEKSENQDKKKAGFFDLIDKMAEVVEFDVDEAETTGKLRADKALRRSPIGDVDVQIAATAISCNATLVTGNSKHFSKIPGLRLLAL